MDKDLKKLLERIVGKKKFSDRVEDLLCASYDGTRDHAAPEVLVKPADEEEVSRVMRLATENKIPVYPAGARSGLTGGAVPEKGGIALDLTRLNGILEINPASRTAIAQAGVILGDLQKASARHGLFYPPDPASTDYATLGGSIAECSGGLRCVKYGVTRDYVLGLRAVLPDGAIIKLGSKAIKNVVGYDVMRLIVGSEGTLAIITEATVRLRLLPEFTRMFLGWFKNLDLAARAVQAVLDSGASPRMVELIDKNALGAVAKYAEGLIPENAGAAILVELDGLRDCVEVESARVRHALEKAGAFDQKEADDEAGREKLYAVRRNISPALYNLASGKMNEDVSVPIDRISEIFRATARIGEKHGLMVATFAHAGDGNLHVNFMYDASDPESFDKAETCARELFEKVVEVGGSLSGEHGIGTMKRPYLDLELGKNEIALMKRIKNLFDPGGILNPGKIFPDE